MSQSISLWGAQYSNVPAVELPKTGGGTATFTDTSSTTATADKIVEGYGAYSSEGEWMVGSISTKTSSNLTVSGDTVTAPAGYYASSASKSVAAGSVKLPSTIMGQFANVSVASGYVTLSKSISAKPTVTTEGYVTDGTLSAANITLIAEMTTKEATTLYPSGTDQTISSGQYLSGTQTIKAVTTTNLSAANVKDGVVVQVGDSVDSDRVTSVTGTFTDSSTVSSGQTAATSGEILTGYSAWVDGVELQGSLRAMTTTEISNAVTAGWSGSS